MRPNVWILVVVALVLGAAAAPLVGPAAATGSVRLAVFGDTGTTSSTQSNVNGALREGATAYVGLGDYYYYSSPSTWKSMFQPLTRGGAYMALGNHDDRSVLSEYFMEGTTWSEGVNGARLVAINTQSRMDVGSSQYSYVRNALCSAAEPTRILIMHKPWWLGSAARHPGTEFPGSASAMDQMVKDCGVDLVMAGHEHNYQRLMRNGVPYLIVGTGGQSMYAVAGAPTGTVDSYYGHGRLLLDLSAGGFSAEFRSLDGRVRDSFTGGSGSTTASPPPTTTTSGASFTRSTGNEWWVQVKVSATGATVRSVEARDEDTPWRTLTLRWWGDWAGSFHVDPGHHVTYRALLSDGRLVQSCPFTHPAGVASCGGSTESGSFAATFRNARGNDWWVESDVSATGGTLAGVDARANGGAWTALSKTSWGSWAKSFHVAAGSAVEFRARATDGQIASGPTLRWPPG